VEDERKRFVAEGYDRAAERHAAWAQHIRVEERARYIALLLERLPEGATVLELGCGNGIPVARALAERFAVTGVDLSARHVEMARSNVPYATFLQGDMTALDFAPESFDAVTAFYSIIHVPREEHPGLLRDIARWLRPSGLLIAAMGFRSTENAYEQDWLGIPMYFSHFDSPTNQRLVEEAGLRLLTANEETADEDGAQVTFLWVVAQKARVE
jgi:ubiquinone/menaquinone biosynthesis C-methylase UbiE